MSANATTLERTRSIAIVPLGLSLSSFLAITFVLCAIGEHIPGVQKIHLLSALYPGVDWTSAPVLVFGVVAALVLGWYVAILFGLLYNFFAGARR